MIYALAAAALIIIFSLNTYRNDFQNTSRILNIQFQMNYNSSSDDRSRPSPPEKAPSGNSVTEDDTGRNNSGIILVSRDRDRVLYILSKLNTDLSDSDIRTLVRKALATNKRQGIVENWQFETSVSGDDLLIGLSDITQAGKHEIRQIIISLIVASACFLVWRILAVKIADSMIAPLTEAERRQKEFVMFAGHELKTPVAVTRAAYSMMRREGVKSQYLEDAEAENKKMQEMITELLEFSRLDYLKKNDFEKVDLSRTAESSLLSFDAFAFEKGVEMLDEIEQGISVNGDKKMLERMTDTLLENAINHTAAGRKAGIFLKESGDDVILSIKNQGDEIPPDDREKIFELFYHQPEADSDESGEPHFGLGLAIARSIAEKHHSNIEVSCSSGWIEFSVRFSKK